MGVQPLYKDSLYYSGAHSIAIGDVNTWADWRLIPTSRPVINPPEVKTNYVDIPGANGSLDYTEALGGINYGNRTGSWEFMIANGYYDWAELYQAIMNTLHGKLLKIGLWDEADWFWSEEKKKYVPIIKYYYVGRLSVNQWKSDQKYSTITIDYNINPYKMPLVDTAGKPLDPWTPKAPDTDPETGSTTSGDGEPGSGTVAPGGGEGGTSGIPVPGPTPTPTPSEPISYGEWLWDEYFGVDKTIYYGKFTVETSKFRNVYNPNSTQTTIAIQVSSTTMGVVYYHTDGTEPTQYSPSSSGQILITIEPGDNTLQFTGNGSVVISYSTGQSI